MHPQGQVSSRAQQQARYRRRRVAVVLVALCLTWFGGAYLLGRSPVPTKALAKVLPGIGSSSHAPFEGRLLVYGRHGLTAPEVAKLRAVAPGKVTEVYGGEVAVSSGQPTYPVVPVAGITVDAASYASAEGTSGLKDQLNAGVVLSRRGAALRHLAAGGRLHLADGRSLKVSAVVDDAVIGGYEMATTRSVLGHQAGTAASYLLVERGSSTSTTARRLRAALPDRDLRVEASTINGLMSAADSVLTQAQMKTEFGEFALRQGTDGALHLDPAWKKKWVTSTVLPQLGVITCNREVIGHLRAAMVAVTQAGLDNLVHSADFQREGGCWSPRVARFGGGQVSSHAWGIAIDINVDVNPLGAAPHQDPRFVAIMAANGFAWGGRFLRPDGAHFEWVGLPHS